MTITGSGKRPLRIGTRRSDLARRQTGWVAQLIAAQSGAPQIEVVAIDTRGDRLSDVPLSQIEGKAFFTGEIEQSLLAGKIDVAVHSLKDLATEGDDDLAEGVGAGLLLAAVPEREDPRDVVVSRSGVTLAELSATARVGTSSVRRRALLRRLRPDLEPVDLRGNVPTRLAKLAAGEYDAVVLAAAGLRRLGLEERISETLDPERFLPAPAQGALAVQCRERDEETRRWLEPLDHLGARVEVTAERSLLAAVQGGCQAPVGALARASEGRLEMAALVCSLDGGEAACGRLGCELVGEGAADLAAASELGRRLAERLLADGAEAIIRQLRVRSMREGS